MTAPDLVCTNLHKENANITVKFVCHFVNNFYLGIQLYLCLTCDVWNTVKTCPISASYIPFLLGIRRIGIYEPRCSGNEKSILECDHRPWFEGSCRYYDMASVKCHNCKFLVPLIHFHFISSLYVAYWVGWPRLGKLFQISPKFSNHGNFFFCVCVKYQIDLRDIAKSKTCLELERNFALSHLVWSGNRKSMLSRLTFHFDCLQPR